MILIAGKASKRRQLQEISAIKEKRSKQTNASKEEAVVESDMLEEGEAMPTAEQLEEAAKPENSNAIVTVRQKKKQKHLQRLEAQKIKMPTRKLNVMRNI